MKTVYNIFLLLSLMVVTSCEKDEVLIINESNLLIGSWINPVSTNSELKFERTNSLKINKYGISFLLQNECVERSSGFCGTPPLTYFDTKGTWSQEDQIITLFLDTGLSHITWIIKTLDENYLIIERLP